MGVCIFCGNRPEAKTKEHVLPRWLLEYTGDPQRQVHLSTRYERETIKEHKFAFSQFTFPACDECNNAHSGLEGQTKDIILKLVAEDVVTEDELNALLDWLDKVRIGLWLGELQLNGNPLGIRPNFHISQRVGRSDRAVFISKIGPGQALSIFGTRTMAFQWMPSAFGIRINDLFLFNVSTEFLFSKRIGFPYGINATFQKESVGAIYELQQGKQRIRLPLIDASFPIPALCLFQPIFAPFANAHRNLYENDWVRDRAMDIETGRGCIFHCTDDAIEPVSALEGSHYERMRVYDRPNLKVECQSAVLNWQSHLLRTIPSTKLMSKKDRRHLDAFLKLAKNTNADLVRRLAPKE